MLTGKKLGEALSKAIKLKGISKAALAREFKVTPPSIQDWIKYGRIAKKHINHLVDFFSDVVPPEHWGLSKEKITFENPSIDSEYLALLNAVVQKLMSGERSDQMDLVLLAMKQLVKTDSDQKPNNDQKPNKQVFMQNAQWANDI